MRTYSSSIMFNATNKCKWDDEQKMTVYSSHIATLIPNGDFEKVLDASRNWQSDSGIPMHSVLLCLAHIIDEVEVAPDYKGERFEDYVKKLMEASGVGTTTDEKKEPGKTKTGKGRKAKGRAAGPPVQVEQAAPKGPSAPPEPRSEPAEEAGEDIAPREPKPEPRQKFPAGSVQEPSGSSGQPPKVHLVGYLDKPFADISKQLLNMNEPCKDQRLGALMAQQKYQLLDGMELILDLVNGRPKPGVYVYITKDRKTVTQLPHVVHDYVERYEITFKDTTYKVLPPGD